MHEVIIRITDALHSELKDVEDLPLFDVQLNESVVTKMSFHSLDVDEACGVDVLHKGVAQGGDVL